MFKKISVALACASASPLLLAHNTELDTVVVSSAGQNSVYDVAQPVTIVDRDAISANAGNTLGTLLENQPGIANASFGPGVGRPVLRGMSGSRVKILLDGMDSSDVSAMSSDHAPMAEASAADQIEVIQGPATLLYGGGAIGGVVNLIDRRIHQQPQPGLAGEVSARYGSNANSQDIQALLDAGRGNWVLHLDGFSRSSDNYAADGKEIENTDSESSGGSIALSHSGAQGFIGGGISTLDYDYGVPNEDNENNRVRPTQTRYDLKGAWLPLNVPWLQEWRTELSYTDYQHDETDDGLVVGLFEKDTTQFRTTLRHQPFGQWLGSFGLQASIQSLELCHDHAGCSTIPDYSNLSWDGTQGANFTHLNGYEFAHDTPMPLTDTTDLGIYWVEQRDWHFAADQQGTLELGARIDQRTIELDPESITPSSRHDQSYYDDKVFNPLTLSAAATWVVSEYQRWGLSVARAQRAPDAEELFWNGDHHATFSFQLDNPDLDQETAYTADLNWLYQDKTDTLRIAVYHYEYQDYIYNDRKDITDPYHGNMVYRHEQKNARFSGGEFSWQHNLNAQWHVDTNADYVHARLTNGDNLPRIAPASALLALNWKKNRWQTRLEGRFVAEQNDTAANETSTAGYSLLNASVSHDLMVNNNELKLRLALNNITDELARNHVSYLKEYAPLEGRNLQLSARWQF